MPSFMGGDRIVGGAVAPSMIPWQVALLSGNFQFCRGTVLDECTVLSAAHCGITTSNAIIAGSLIKTSVVHVSFYDFFYKYYIFAANNGNNCHL